MRSKVLLDYIIERLRYEQAIEELEDIFIVISPGVCEAYTTDFYPLLNNEEHYVHYVKYCDDIDELCDDIESSFYEWVRGDVIEPSCDHEFGGTIIVPGFTKGSGLTVQQCCKCTLTKEV